MCDKIIFCSVFFLSCCGFNIDVNHPIIYVDQTKYINVRSSNKSSYFGYSVILYPGNNIDLPWIQIGAPRGNSPNVNYDNPGVIFRCRIAGLCDFLEIDKGSINEDGFYVNKLDNAWIGGIMDVNYDYDRIVVCAPRWVNIFRPNSKNGMDYRMMGACYWTNFNETKFKKKLPLLTNSGSGNRDVFSPNQFTSVYEYGQGESGFAAHFPKRERELLLGAPGVLNWKGTSIIYRDSDNTGDEQIYSKKREISSSNYEDLLKGFSDINIVNARNTIEITAYDLFGYSVTSGYFYSEHQLLYAGGAPKSLSYQGQVLIHQLKLKHDQGLNVIESKKGTQFGEYFGACITAGDINGDKLDDLLVGAPFYRSSKYDEGRIYLYLGSKKGRLVEPTKGKTIDGTYEGGLFGSAITILGDIDMDNYADVAVSAPFEEESGVVYIFKGTKQGIDIVPSQRIVGKSILKNLRGFGMSISKPADIDRNGYGDIAIGAHTSGHVVLLRTKPIGIVKKYFDAKDLQSIRTDSKSINITICYLYETIRGLEEIKISRSIFVDEQLDRAYLADRSIQFQTKTLTYGNLMCEANITINLKETLTNVHSPLIITVNTSHIEEKQEKENIMITNRVTNENHPFCLKCVKYDEYRSTKTITQEISFALGCGEDNICDSALEFSASFRGDGVRNGTYLLGSDDHTELITKITNNGEKAYLLQLQVELPEDINFRYIPKACSETNQSIILCSVANPLNTSDSKSIVLDLDMKYVNIKNLENFVNINLTVLTNSKNKNVAKKTITLGFKIEADISIAGNSEEQSYPYGDVTHKRTSFAQIYQIKKYGASPIAIVSLEINIPYALRTDSGIREFLQLYHPEGSLGQQPLNLQSNFTYIQNSSQSTDSIDANVDIRPENIRHIEFVDQDHNKTKYFEKVAAGDKNFNMNSTRTININCSMDNIICGKVICVSGPYNQQSDWGAVIQLKMLLNVAPLMTIMGKKDAILLSTSASVHIDSPSNFIQSGNGSDYTDVTTLFVSDANKKYVDTWVIIVSVIAGISLLILVILILIKVGFFKRSKKEELQQLKAEADFDINKFEEEKNDATLEAEPE